MKNNSTKHALSRRSFMKLSAGYTAMSAMPWLGSLAGLASSSAQAASANPGDYKALVCIYLHGGNDAFNMLAPFGNTEHAHYVTARGGFGPAGLALDRTVLASGAYLEEIADLNSPRSFGLHSSMPEMKSLYENRNLAFLANVGSLVEPVTKATYNAKTVSLPLGLFSHNDQSQHWRTSTPDSRVNRIGWLGRMADSVFGQGINISEDFASISIDSTNLMQSGVDVQPYVVHNTAGATELSYYKAASSPNHVNFHNAYKAVINELFPENGPNAISSQYNAMQNTYSTITRHAIDRAASFNDAISTINLGITFPSTPMGAKLEMIAKIIAARSELDVSRQTFYIGGPGTFDLHSSLLSLHPNLLAQVSEAMAAFYEATERLCVENNVTTFTATEFGRTLTSNGNGSDHAWGGHSMIMGGAVQGGRVYGEYPESLELDGDLDIGRGRLIPTTSVDEYFADMARWFGMSDADINKILPNLSRFSNAPLGFMGQGKSEPCVCTA